MKLSDFDYQLPGELIAQTPAEPRDTSRLLVLHRREGIIAHTIFREIVNYLPSPAVMVLNDTRVIPARLEGKKQETGGKVEILLIRPSGEEGCWEALVRPGSRVKEGTKVQISSGIQVEVLGRTEAGTRLVCLRGPEEEIFRLGQVPLPPYIHTPLADPERYQTVYARATGSIAAPTAGLHFTPELLKKLENRGIQILYITLHLGLDSIRSLREEKITVHREFGEVSPEVAERLRSAKGEGQPIICVGTSTVRMVEHLARQDFRPFTGWVDLFITPGHEFKGVDMMVTNFHLPRSTHLMLVCAFAGRERILDAYREAVALRYRFYSFGDAMLIL